MAILWQSDDALLQLLPSLTVVWIVGYVVYQLYLHPLARLPGPKLAALSTWYEAYFQLFAGQGGQYIFEVEKMQKRYSPIVRIGPNELHCNDPDFYDSIYSQGANIDRPEYTKHMFGFPGTVIAAFDSELHKHRRSALNPFFSKRKILEQEKTIRRQVSKLCDNIEREFADNEKVLRIDYALIAMSTDIIVDYVFDRSNNYLDAPGFKSPFVESLEALKKGAHTARFFPWLGRAIRSLPDSWVKRIAPKAAPTIELRVSMEKQIIDLKADNTKGMSRTKGTILAELVNSPLPPTELAINRLTDEAVGLVAAAVETTKTVTCAIIVHVLLHEPIHRTLLTEPRTAYTDPATPPSITDLEKLPYLTAIIQEGLRLGYGIVRRSPRIHKSQSLTNGTKHIPAGTLLSASTYTMHHNETIFPDSHTFRPERWLDNPKGPDGRPLSRYITAFNRGTRMCLGWQLAEAVMRVVVAELVRRFELRLYETGLRDVECTCDFVAPGVAEGSHGVMVKVERRKHAERED